MARYSIVLNHVIEYRLRNSIPEAIERSEFIDLAHNRVYLSELSESQMRSLGNLIGAENVSKRLKEAAI